MPKPEVYHDFPKPGIKFFHIFPDLMKPNFLKNIVEEITNKINEEKISFDFIVSPESRGWVFAYPLSLVTSKGVIPVRRSGKLPGKTCDIDPYDCEYENRVMQIPDIFSDKEIANTKVIIVDDVLATGNTAKAIYDLLIKKGVTVQAFFFYSEIAYLPGRELLESTSVPVIALEQWD